MQVTRENIENIVRYALNIIYGNAF